MRITRVYKNFNQFYFFPDRDYEEYVYNKCKYCGIELDPYYSMIIRKLKTTNLLSEEYEDKCCLCFTLKKELGFFRCIECDGEITILEDVNSNMVIFCISCGKVYKRIMVNKDQK